MSYKYFMYRSITLCTLQFPVRVLDGGGRVGGSSAVMLLNRICGVRLQEEWNHPLALVHKTTYAPMIYTVPVHNAFDAGSIHFLGKWEGVGPKNLDFFGPQMAFAYRRNAI